MFNPFAFSAFRKQIYLYRCLERDCGPGSFASLMGHDLISLNVLLSYDDEDVLQSIGMRFDALTILMGYAPYPFEM